MRMQANAVAVKPRVPGRSPALRMRLPLCIPWPVVLRVRGPADPANERIAMIEVEPDPEPEKLFMTARRRKARPKPRIFVWLWRLVAALVILALIPVLLALLYKWPAIHPLSTLMMKDIVTFQDYERQWTPLEGIGDRLIHSVVMSEDGQFCSHHGVDLGELRVLIAEALAGEETRGGSTITMQTTKNLFLWHGRSYIRKAIELPLSVYLDLVMSKKRIMEIYLNIAEWGPGIYGAEAAAQYHFGRSTDELTSRQAALLAVTLPNPYLRDPANPSPSLNEVATIIERRADRAGGYVGCLQ